MQLTLDVQPPSSFLTAWCPLQVPDLAEDMHFCFTDNQGNWESNFGNNYQVAISGEWQ